MDYIQTKDAERFLTEGELSQFLNLPVRTLQAWRLRGEGPPFFKLGRAVRYRSCDVEAWLAENRATSTASTTARSSNG